MRQDSDSDLVGKLGATLTAPVVRTHMPRGEQSSGFFDLHSLYEMHVERGEAAPLVVVPVPRIAPPLQVPMRAPQVTAVDAYEVALARGIPRPIGWYGVFVTWLATATLAAAVATQVPAHVRTRVRPIVATATATAAPTATATATPTSSVPVFVVSDLPRAQTKAPAPATHVKLAAAAPVRTAAPSTAPASSPAPVAVAPPPPAHAATAAAPPAPTPPSTGGSSLEDLIRREVAAEQKKIRAAKGQ
jgi:hypothetical protein